MSKLIFILQDAFHVAGNIAFATVKSLTDICYSSNTILFFINCVHYPPPHTHISPCCHGKKYNTVKSLTDIGNSSNTILFFINCVHYPPPHTHISPFCHGKKI